jgi:hypothetical protein
MVLTFIKRDDRVDRLSDRHCHLLLLGFLPIPDQPPIQDEDQHRTNLDETANSDVSEIILKFCILKQKKQQFFKLLIKSY